MVVVVVVLVVVVLVPGVSVPQVCTARCLVSNVHKAKTTFTRPVISGSCRLTVPESPSAVLALVPDPAGEARAAAGGGVALPVHARLVALLRLGDAGQRGEQPGGREQERGRQHQEAPDATPRAGAGAGPPRRPVHFSSPKRWLLRGKRAPPPLPLPLLRGETATHRAAGSVRGSRFNGRPVRVLVPRCSSVSALRLVFAGYSVYIFPVVPFPSAAPSRILTSRSDVMAAEMRNRGGRGREGLLNFYFENRAEAPPLYMRAR